MSIQFINKGLYKSKTEINLSIKYGSFRKYIGGFCVKNLFVRSLLTLSLVNKDAALIHGGGFVINGKSFVVAGRPGVFKTSLMMDAIRIYNAKFFGDENIIVKGDKIYSFPLNISSFLYKLNNFENENAESKIKKLKLWSSLFWQKYKDNGMIAEPLRVNCLLYLRKSDTFSIKEISKEKMLKYLINNELEELNIPPTHNLSGIKLTNFHDYLKKHNATFPKSQYENFIDKLGYIISLFIKDASVYEVTVPEEYSKSLLNTIISKVS